MLSIGGNANVSQAQIWKTSLDLSFEVLADPNYEVFFDYTFGAPWDAIVGANHVLAMNENSYQFWDSTLNMTAIMGVLNSLFAPQPEATPNPLVFGEVEVGSFEDQALVLKNVGTGVLVLQNINSSNPAFSANPTQDSIFAVGDSAVIMVRFQPLEVGQINATLTFVTPNGNLVVPVQGNAVSAVEPGSVLPQAFSVGVYPNPFNPELHINLNLPRQQDVSVDVYTITGTPLTALYRGRLEVGQHRMTWAAQESPSGIYLLRIVGKDWQEIKRVALVR